MVRWLHVVISQTLRKFLDNPRSVISFCKKHFYYRFIADKMIMKYEKFHFLDYSETLDYIIENRVSLIRFGDEIFDMLQGLGLYFNDWHQKYSPSLEGALRDIFVQQDKRILLSFNPELILRTHAEMKKDGIGNQWQFWINSKIFLHQYLREDQIYGSALLFHLRYNPNLDFDKLGAFFKNKHIIIIVHNSVRFETCQLGKTTDFIEAPESDAWESYDIMKNQIFDIIEKNQYNPSDVLVLGSASSATKVLAWDLHINHDIVSWDTGQFFDIASTRIRDISKV